MKQLKDILEGIFDIDDNIDNVDRVCAVKFIDKYVSKKTRRFIVISDEKNADGKYVVSSTGSVWIANKPKHLTNEFFTWGTINGDFVCSYNDKLVSLDGAPEKVIGNFKCAHCNYLKDLKGSPEFVGKDYICYMCDSLESLEGVTQKIPGKFECYNGNSLTSLEGAPKKVGEGFSCGGCKVKFTEEDVKKVSDVKGNIYV